MGAVRGQFGYMEPAGDAGHVSRASDHPGTAIMIPGTFVSPWRDGTGLWRMSEDYIQTSKPSGNPLVEKSDESEAVPVCIDGEEPVTLVVQPDGSRFTLAGSCTKDAGKRVLCGGIWLDGPSRVCLLVEWSLSQCVGPGARILVTPSTSAVRLLMMSSAGAPKDVLLVRM